MNSQPPGMNPHAQNAAPLRRGNAGRKIGISILVVLLLGSAAFVCIKYYSFVFSRTIKGEFINIERIEPPAVFSNNATDAAMRTQMFSFAVAIRTADGEIHTASSEDRQWAVALKGMCGDARFYPYPFWDLDKIGTWQNARLLKMYDCAGKAGPGRIPVPASSIPAGAATVPPLPQLDAPPPAPTF